MTRRGRQMARALWLDVGLALLLVLTLFPALHAPALLLLWMLAFSAFAVLSYRAQFLAADELGRRCLTRSLAVAGGLAIIGLANLVMWGLAHANMLPMLAVWGVLMAALAGQFVSLWWQRRSQRAGA